MFGLSQTLDECLATVLDTSEKYATSLKTAKQTQLSSAKEELKGTDHELGEHVTYDDCMERINNGDVILRPFFVTTSTMASQQARCHLTQEIHARWTKYATYLQELLRCEMGVVGRRVDLTATLQAFTDLANTGGKIPLFDASKAMDRFRQAAVQNLSHVSVSNVDYTAFQGLQEWFEGCYTQCIRIEARQVVVAMVQDVKLYLPAMPVCYALVPLEGWGCINEQSFML